ncbi:hypothetical protein JBO49_02815 [Serratia fonticola]|uniref:hypothetical protein n=1 Tax=Serratia fonticola TaxID=47917 RepID=UPI00192BD045|nr:hypothetical protein [Serratia fonticola]MBL5859544.1 hypothetical protein [Serratia fonticola]
MPTNKWGPIVVYIFALAAAYCLGKIHGNYEASLECADGKTQSAVTALNSVTEDAKQLTQQANKISQLLSAQMNAFNKANEKSTEDFINALKKTAAARGNCVLDDDIMRQLNAARERSATAAATGLSGSNDRSLPAASKTGG